MTRYYWDQCYELGPRIHWALCDDENAKDGRVSCMYMVLHAAYETRVDGQPLSEQFMPKKIVDLLNGESDSIKELQHLHNEVSDFEELVAAQDAQLCELRKEVENLLLYKRAMESMANQLVCPKMTAEELAKNQLGLEETDE